MISKRPPFLMFQQSIWRAGERERGGGGQRALIAFSKYPELVCSIPNIAVVSQSKEFDTVSFITVKRLENLL
jgi:hypothetical protein